MMELPIFAGEDAHGWLTWIKRLEVNDIVGDKCLDLVLVALEGMALKWFRTWQAQVAFPSWRQFREAVLCRFQPGVVKDPYRPLLKLRETGSVIDYID